MGIHLITYQKCHIHVPQLSTLCKHKTSYFVRTAARKLCQQILPYRACNMCFLLFIITAYRSVVFKLKHFQIISIEKCVIFCYCICFASKQAILWIIIFIIHVVSTIWIRWTRDDINSQHLWRYTATAINYISLCFHTIDQSNQIKSLRTFECHNVHEKQLSIITHDLCSLLPSKWFDFQVHRFDLFTDRSIRKTI